MPRSWSFIAAAVSIAMLTACDPAGAQAPVGTTPPPQSTTGTPRPSVSPPVASPTSTATAARSPEAGPTPHLAELPPETSGEPVLQYPASSWSPIETSPSDGFYPGEAIHASENGIVSPFIGPHLGSPAAIDIDPLFPGELYPGSPDVWHWRLLPSGLIYRSYWAGPREPRISTVFFEEAGQTLWDPILGGRAALLRYGTYDPLHPQGWELDIEGAAMVRLNLDHERDVDSTDYRFGVPLTYGVDNWQFKFGYYHLSSHLGDEFIARNPGAMRINYVRDAIVVGASVFPTPTLRLYGETAYAFYTSGGAEPWEFQFGAEYSWPGETGTRGSPFLAINAHLHEEINYNGDFTAQAGWLWRGPTGHIVRTGVHYLNGYSSQYQFFMYSEQQLGWGLWFEY